MGVFQSGLQLPVGGKSSFIDSLREEVFIPQPLLTLVVIEDHTTGKSALGVIPTGLPVELTVVFEGVIQVCLSLPGIDIRVVTFLLSLLDAVDQSEGICAVGPHITAVYREGCPTGELSPIAQ